MEGNEHILAVGDIHGCHHLLLKVFDEVLPQIPPQTRLVFVGDYIDRGPDSARVVRRLINLKKQRPDTIFLLGNHEWMLLEALEGRRVDTFVRNGGDATLASYGLHPHEIQRLPDDHQDFYRSLRLYWETDRYLFVHAGLRPSLPLAEQKTHDLLWIREEFFNSQNDLGWTVVFGHTPFKKPYVRPHMIGIDTGAVYGNGLTCVKLPQGEFFTL